MKRLASKLKRSVRKSTDVRVSTEPATSDTEPPTPAVLASGDGPADAERESTPTKKHNCDGSLESLLPEVRRQLLSTLDLPRLKALVRASPTFHQQYLFDRNYLFRTSLENSLGSAIVDACALYLYTSTGKDTRQNESLKLYSTKSSQKTPLLAGKLSHDEPLNIGSFYFNYVQPLVGYYARWVLRNLAKEVGKDADTYDRITLTRTEELRLTRAMYRFQLLCQLADPVEDRSHSSRESATRAFLDLLEPWEIEELFSFYQFSQDVYDGTLNDVSWDLHPENPKFDDQGRLPTPEGAYDLEILSKLSYPNPNAAHC